MDRVLIADGGLATALERAGERLDPRLWSAGVFLARPRAVEDLHRAYLDAGADLITAASYQMSFEGLAGAGLDAEAAARAMRATVDVARRAVQRSGRAALVAASVGPYGAVRADGSEYRGRYRRSEEWLARFHRRRLSVLASAGADLLALETLPSLAEVRALCGLLSRLPQARAWISFSCADGRRLRDGHDVAQAARLADRCAQVFAIGVNCTHPRWVAALMTRIRSVSGKPLIVYPNSGERWNARTRTWAGRFAAESFLDLAEGWAARGAWAVGGCCRVGPDEIRRLARRLAGGR